MFFPAVLTLCIALTSGAHIPRIQMCDTEVHTTAKESEWFVPITDMIHNAGYPSETHTVTTEDGYVLTLHRIPRGRKPVVGGVQPVAFVMHGLLSSAADWVVTGPEKGFVFMLADAGYDVWMGNARGNTYSKKHVTMDPKNGDFWNFSWHQIGKYDLPAMIDYTLNATAASSLHYTGHSQGTTTFFIMTSLLPEYNAKIRSMHALAPVAYLSNIRSSFLRMVAQFEKQAEWVLKMLGVNEFLPHNDLLSAYAGMYCEDESATQQACHNIVFIVVGVDTKRMNATIIPNILANIPAGSSVKQVQHYGQLINSGRFCQFDYGRMKNLIEYGTVTPPSYPLEAVTCPVALHISDSDISDGKDVGKLAARLPNLIGKFRVPDANFNHLDFLWAANVDVLLYNKIIRLMNRY